MAALSDRFLHGTEPAGYRDEMRVDREAGRGRRGSFGAFDLKLLTGFHLHHPVLDSAQTRLQSFDCLLCFRNIFEQPVHAANDPENGPYARQRHDSGLTRVQIKVFQEGILPRCQFIDLGVELFSPGLEFGVLGGVGSLVVGAGQAILRCYMLLHTLN